MIKIIDGYEFEHDGKCFILYEVGTREKGVFGKVDAKSGEMVEYRNALGYYGTLRAMCEACLKFATQKAADAAGVKTLGDYISIMEQIADEIKSAVNVTAF